MTITVNDLGALFSGIEPHFLYQVAAGGNQFVVMGYDSFNTPDSSPVTFVVWNLDTDTVATLTVPGTSGSFGDYCITQISTGRIAIAAASYCLGYYFEIDLVNKTIPFNKLIGNSGDAFSAQIGYGPANYVLIGSGTSLGHQYLEWCDPGGGNWVTHTLTSFTALQYVRGMLALHATDGHNYAYCYQYPGDFIVAVRMDNGAEKVLFASTYEYVTTQQVTLDGGSTYLVYADCYNLGGDNTHHWFKLDGIAAPQSVSAPSAGQIKSATFFEADIYPIDATNIIPNASGQSTLAYTRSAVVHTVTATGITLEATTPRLFSSPWPDGNVYIQTNEYGPIYRFNPSTATPTQLGYTSTILSRRNPYVLNYDRNLGLGIFSGYHKDLEYWNPTLPWTRVYGADEFSSAVNPHLVPQGLAFRGTHFSYCEVNAVTKNIYASSSGTGELGYYNPGTQLWTVIDFGANYDVVDMKAIRAGHFIAISMLNSSGPGVIKLFHDPSGTVVKSLVLDDSLADFGHMVEVGTTQATIGHIIVVRGNHATGCKVWRINTYEIMPAAVVWSASITGNAFNNVGDPYSDLELGPDGFVYLYIGTSIYKIDPADGTQTQINPDVGSVPANCRLRWVGNDLYAYGGDTHLYKISGLV